MSSEELQKNLILPDSEKRPRTKKVLNRRNFLTLMVGSGVALLAPKILDFFRKKSSETPSNNLIEVGEFEHWNGSEFENTEVLPENVEPVIFPPQAVGDSYTALPSIARYGETYVCVFETQLGFCMTTSTDGVHWTEGEVILQFPQGQYPHVQGQEWFSNPTLWSLDQPSDQVINSEGLLLYSAGQWDKPHLLEKRSFILKF